LPARDRPVIFVRLGGLFGAAGSDWLAFCEYAGIIINCRLGCTREPHALSVYYYYYAPLRRWPGLNLKHQVRTTSHGHQSLLGFPGFSILRADGAVPLSSPLVRTDLEWQPRVLPGRDIVAFYFWPAPSTHHPPSPASQLATTRPDLDAPDAKSLNSPSFLFFPLSAGVSAGLPHPCLPPYSSPPFISLPPARDQHTCVRSRDPLLILPGPPTAAWPPEPNTRRSLTRQPPTPRATSIISTFEHDQLALRCP